MIYTFILLAFLNGQPFGAFLVSDEATCEQAKARLTDKTDFTWQCVVIGGTLEPQ